MSADVMDQLWERAKNAGGDSLAFVSFSNACAQWGADQELEACIKWTAANFGELPGQNLHLYRRPKPLTLAEQALRAIVSGFDPEGRSGQVVIEALERLAELEAKQ
jgi:hypothetical protein